MQLIFYKVDTINKYILINQLFLFHPLLYGIHYLRTKMFNMSCYMKNRIGKKVSKFTELTSLIISKLSKSRYLHDLFFISLQKYSRKPP